VTNEPRTERVERWPTRLLRARLASFGGAMSLEEGFLHDISTSPET
jgi:hypothetical protein